MLVFVDNLILVYNFYNDDFIYHFTRIQGF